ncbi:cysteine/serine-rich nuclear protein 2 [Scleropages formosus]|uniref:Cysteine and serine rich nuclear protein 2 n=1 Tax=Scleropages formosus TaxID=113540 RepID=A0A8D0CFM7_SCLFO|nr:cysteine/serine-rich nuclear protein 2 [Scleropages formosus]
MEATSALGLKRKFEEVDSGSPYSTPKDSDDDISSSDSADSCDSLNAPSTTSLLPPSILRRHKASPGPKRVRFDAVTVYYFSRRQGFTSVPSQGGSSLGMARRHSAVRRYTLGEFARQQERSHRQALRQHLRMEKLNARKRKLTRNGTVACAAADALTLEDVSDEDLDVEGVTVDDCFFLQPLPTKRRRALLRASGIARIDASEKAELRALRLSREECGCDCRSYCDPRRCGCSQAGIKCQVDRMSFPCGCSRDGCGNAAGRIEFNPLRVRTHYLHTIMKLGLEKKRSQELPVGEGFEAQELSSASAATHSEPTDPCEVELVSGSLAVPAVGPEADLAAQPDSLALENEAAVLHLQSAEEWERRREEEEAHGGLSDPGLCLLSEAPRDGAVEQGPEPFIIQGAFPTGTPLLCFTENQLDAHDSSLLKESSSLVYYHMGPVEPAAFQEARVEGGGEREEEAFEVMGCQQDLEENPTIAVSCSESGAGSGEGQSAFEQGSLQRPLGPQSQCQGDPCSAFEGEGNSLPSEV